MKSYKDRYYIVNEDFLNWLLSNYHKNFDLGGEVYEKRWGFIRGELNRALKRKCFGKIRVYKQDNAKVNNE